MSAFYLALAAVIAILLVSGRVAVRLGAGVTALALGFLCWSIWLANLDGTFATGGWRVWALNTMMAVGAVLCLALVAAMFRRNGSGDVFPLPSRLVHWASAVLMLAALPMGLFVTVLRPERAERAEFLAAHLAVGLAALVLLPLRLWWRRRAALPVAVPARLGQSALYLAVLLAGASGLMLAAALGVPVFGLVLPQATAAGTARAAHIAAAALFAFAFAAHLTGALLSHLRRERLRMI